MQAQMLTDIIPIMEAHHSTPRTACYELQTVLLQCVEQAQRSGDQPYRLHRQHHIMLD
jgi:hypothetical protein